MAVGKVRVNLGCEMLCRFEILLPSFPMMVDAILCLTESVNVSYTSSSSICFSLSDSLSNEVLE